MTLTIGSDVTVTDVDDGIILLNERDGRYWQLNRSGAATLRLLLDGRTTDEAAVELTRRNPNAAERARADITRLVDALLTSRLVVRS